MLKRNFLIVLLLLFSSNIFSQKVLQLSSGLKYGGISNTKNTRDSFSKGLGISLESGLRIKDEKVYMGFFSTDFLKSSNSIGTDKLNCYFITFYFFPLDWKFDIHTSESGKLTLFTSAAIAPQRMYIQGISGFDRSWLVSSSIGMKYWLSGEKMLLLQFRPYIMAGNQLMEEASFPWGFEIKFSMSWYVWHLNFR